MSWGGYHGHIAVTISNGTSLSAAVQLDQNQIPVGIMMSAAWDAANLTFQASHDGATFQELYDSANNAVQVSAAAQRCIGFESAVALEAMRSPLQLKIRSGTSGVPVNQTADRVLYLLVREYI
jgi:hypothetical protein